MDEDESLVRRRPRRSTAGNRMQAALAEFADAEQEAEEDKDFMIDQDEEDVFGSDFESTDEETAEQAPDHNEKAVQDDERKAARSRVEKATAVAHARQKVTFNPEAYEDTAVPEKGVISEKRKRRVSLGLAINAETGEVMTSAKRQSRRAHTIQNTKAAFIRMIDAEEKKACFFSLPLSVEALVSFRALTQNELIARALDMEDGNIVEHKQYLTVEEEKRKRAHVVRTAIEGPLLRWISKRETIKVAADARNPTKIEHSGASSNNPVGVPATPSQQFPTEAEVETVSKNYVIHEASQSDDASKPPWKDTMAAMFGDHVKWEDLKIYANRNRPLSRPVQICPITGLPAPYLDPRTNVPYATRASQSRPRTAQSRPSTARPITAASSRHEGSYVVAIIEGRGVAREIGMAALDKDTGRLTTFKLADCQTYVKSLHQMHLHTPALVLVPDTFISATDTTTGSGGKKPNTTSLLVQCIQDEFPNVPVDAVLRKYWNDDAGLQFINQLCVQDSERAATLVAASNKYYALSAASALFKHVEVKLNTRFAPGSLRIRFVAVEGTMMIDPETARNLELVGNMSQQKSQHSVFGVLNHTHTAMAARTLRANILAPITVQSAINARLDVVEELVQSEETFTAIKSALKPLNKQDFDKLISSLAASEYRVVNTAKTASSRVANMLNLRCIVRSLPALQKALAGCKSQLMHIMSDMLADERLEKIEQLVSDSLNEDAIPSKGGLAAINARVYAIKANRNPLLDVARETYKENIGDIMALNKALSEKHGLPLTLVYQDNGFVLALKKNDIDGNLPFGFVNISMRKGRSLFSSMELKKRNARMKDALDETLILSDATIQDLVSEILKDVGALYKASEAVALLDMLWSFAHVSIREASTFSVACLSYRALSLSLVRNYVRPEFTGTLAVKSGRHPVLESVQTAGTLVPNDVYCSDSSAFQIIQGPNMSGKSTYLRQTGLLTVIAMCGCFVPAQYASLRIHTALLTRLSNDDDMEKSLSTFANEMAAAAMILGLADSQSLVLIDELGRGTSPREGVGISHAIAEALIKRKCFVFFATHFHELSVTLSRHPSVINLHLSTQKTRHSSSSFGMRFQYKKVFLLVLGYILTFLFRIVDGVPEDMEHYGLELARLADFPNDVLVESRMVATQLADLEACQNEESESSKVATRRKVLLKLRTQLTQALEHSALPNEEFVSYISRFQKDTVKMLYESLQ
ncbi:hypothetical protein EVG20_g2859 [Dentipellis fragilis]|uniref:DNA mismatch repair protein MSH3 n=1 Tax=Dentipellis fragilis TaxID=205917 RepID=A0A4Y9Z6J7_9AGAM|nr:hypothetical protein EVG20_g2859 [Dentipellis fragilis]